REAGRPARHSPTRARRGGGGHVRGGAVPRTLVVRHRNDARRGRRLLPWPLTDHHRRPANWSPADEPSRSERTVPRPRFTWYCATRVLRNLAPAAESSPSVPPTVSVTAWSHCQSAR